MQNVIAMKADMLSVDKLSVAMLNVVAPCKLGIKMQKYCLKITTLACNLHCR